jgi:hypothetical protein
MRRLIPSFGVLALVMALLTLFSQGGRPVVLFAQVPATFTVGWTQPDAATNNATSYTITLDTGTPQVLMPTACVGTSCTGTVTVTSFGSHQWSVFGTNTKVTCTDGTCTPPVTQNGQTSTQHFVVNPPPAGGNNQNIR